MKSGKWLRSQIRKSMPHWQDKFICYKQLKKQLKPCGNVHANKRRLRFANAGGGRVRANVGFARMLDTELEKVNTFFLEKEEDYIIRVKELQNRVANLGNNEEVLQLEQDILYFHGEMVLLLHYSVLNFTGYVKIVKKHNKKTSISFQLPFMPTGVQQPFFSTDLLFNLMRDCEAMLNQLFHRNH